MLHAYALAALALAASPAASPLLTLTQSLGYVPQNSAVYTRCAIFEDRVEMTISSAEGQTTSVVPSTLGGDISAIIGAAKNSKLERAIGPVDGPTARRLAYARHPDGSPQEVDLGSEIDGERTSNPSLAANHLLRILAAMCR